MKETTGAGVAERPKGQLRLPAQAMPIDRTATGVALATAAGVEAAGWWDIVKTIGSGLGTVGDTLWG